jgi:hypothetical protein
MLIRKPEMLSGGVKLPKPMPAPVGWLSSRIGKPEPKLPSGGFAVGSKGAFGFSRL